MVVLGVVFLAPVPAVALPLLPVLKPPPGPPKPPPGPPKTPPGPPIFVFVCLVLNMLSIYSCLFKYVHGVIR